MASPRLNDAPPPKPMMSGVNAVGETAYVASPLLHSRAAVAIEHACHFPRPRPEVLVLKVLLDVDLQIDIEADLVDHRNESGRRLRYVIHAVGKVAVELRLCLQGRLESLRMPSPR